MHRWILAASVASLAGCAASVHPRVGTGVPAPDWVEFERPVQPKETSEAVEDAPVAGPREIVARHILISFRGAAHAEPTMVRSKHEAHDRAHEVIKRLKAGEDFAALAKEYTDEPGGGERAGDLGRFTRDKMVKKFSDAAFKLQPGEISEPVETQFGYHVIQRTE